MNIQIYGASDDLIEIEGDIREEFNASRDTEGDILACSDGTALRIRYDQDGIWRINRISKGTAQYEHTEATDSDTDYSDRVKLIGDIEWIVCGVGIAK